MLRIDKVPGYCESPDALEVGDILIFNINPKRRTEKGASITVRQQAWLNEPGGHKDTVHAALVIEHEGMKKIAHLRATGFVLDDLNIIKTTTHVYRPVIHAEKLRVTLNDVIAQKNANKHPNNKLTWHKLISLRAYLQRLFSSIGIRNQNLADKPIAHPENLPERPLSGLSICSKFVADCYIAACYRMTKEDEHDYRRELMNISSFTTPKTLQAYLYRNANFNYQILSSDRGNLYTNLRNTVINELDRLRASSTPAALRKAGAISKALQEFNAGNLEGNEFERAIELLNILIPILRRNTGLGMKTPTSYLKVMNYAKSQGLYRSYFERNLDYDPKSNLSKPAKRDYHYSKPLAEMYETYRKLGYSDKEARFECKPNFSSWLKMNPARNIAAGVTGVGFLFGSFPYGLFRVVSCKRRNAQLLGESNSVGKKPILNNG